MRVVPGTHLKNTNLEIYLYKRLTVARKYTCIQCFMEVCKAPLYIYIYKTRWLVYFSKVWLNRSPTLQHIRLKFKKRLLKFHIWSLSLYSAETWTLWKIDQKYLGSFEMWCWRRMEKISCTKCVWNEEVLHGVEEERNILHKQKANWIGHILHRNCLLKPVTEGKIERIIQGVTGGMCKTSGECSLC